MKYPLYISGPDHIKFKLICDFFGLDKKLEKAMLTYLLCLRKKAYKSYTISGYCQIQIYQTVKSLHPFGSRHRKSKYVKVGGEKKKITVYDKERYAAKGGPLSIYYVEFLYICDSQKITEGDTLNDIVQNMHFPRIREPRYRSYHKTYYRSRHQRVELRTKKSSRHICIIS